MTHYILLDSVVAGGHLPAGAPYTVHSCARTHAHTQTHRHIPVLTSNLYDYKGKTIT